MTKWGLTKNQIRLEPWGIPEYWLQPDKRITDPIHGKVYINRLERHLLDSRPLQRLRRVRQLGTAHLVYPGATHTRLSHVLGTLRAAQDLLDAAQDHANGPDPVDDFFSALEPDALELAIAEATVLARLGGLLHDICHVPFGHTVEDDLQLLVPHDRNEARFERLWLQIPDRVRDAISDDLLAELKRLILSKVYDASGSKYPFVADIVGNTICADLLDYVQRDHHYTGLPLAIGEQFLDDFFVSSREIPQADHQARMVVQVVRDGRERHDTRSELLKVVRYRYEDDERVLVHHAKLAADAMLGKLIEMWSDELWSQAASVRTGDKSLKAIADIEALRSRVIGLGEDAAAIDQAVANELESAFCRWGDDGLLERLAELGDGAEATARARAVGRLADALLHRELYKPLAHSNVDARSNRQPLYDAYKDPGTRRKVEEDGARFAGLGHGAKVVLWVPNPKMRMKSVDVLVGDGAGQLSTLNDHEKEKGRRQAEVIYESHRDLWSLSVFIHPDIPVEDRQVVLAWLSKRLGVNWDGDPVPSLYRLAVETLSARHNLVHTERERLLSLDEPTQALLIRDGVTFTDIVDRIESGHLKDVQEPTPDRERITAWLDEWRAEVQALDPGVPEHGELKTVIYHVDDIMNATGNDLSSIASAADVGRVNLRLLLSEYIRAEGSNSVLAKEFDEATKAIQLDGEGCYEAIRGARAAVAAQRPPSGRQVPVEESWMTWFELGLKQMIDASQ
ncbi:MAG: hypothetical protein WD557_01710 [Dehalococcoidia bacterium]